jgi:hypothetical protein
MENKTFLKLKESCSILTVGTKLKNSKSIFHRKGPYITLSFNLLKFKSYYYLARGSGFFYVKVSNDKTGTAHHSEGFVTLIF